LFDIPGETAPVSMPAPPPVPAPETPPTPETSATISEGAAAAEAPTPAPTEETPPAPKPQPREPRTLLLTEWFPIDHGQIQHIEAVMHNLPHGSKSGWELED